MVYVLRVSDVVPGPLGKTYYEFQKMTKNNKATFSFVSHFLEGFFSRDTREVIFTETETYTIHTYCTFSKEIGQYRLLF